MLQTKMIRRLINSPFPSTQHSRSFHDNRELLTIEEVCDSEGNTLPKNSVELVPQSLVDGKYWLDNGEFELTVRVQ